MNGLALPLPTAVPGAMTRMASIRARFATTLGESGADSATLAKSLSDSSFSSLLDSLSGADDTSASGLDTSTSNQLTALLAQLRSSNGTGTTAGSAADGAAPTGGEVISDAVQYLGVPYKWGGTDPDVGLDCSGFTQRVYADLGITLPRVAAAQARVGTEVPSLDQAKAGDLLAFGSPVDHIGIYIGNGKMIQSPHTGDVVKISNITRKDLSTIRRILPDAARTWSNPTGTAALDLTGGVAGVNLSGTTDGSLAANVPYRDLFVAAGKKYGLDPALLAAVGKVESNFNPKATSSAGARGLMQFMPATAAGMGLDPLDPAQAIDGAGRYLSTQLARFGSLDKALAAYNAGPRAVERAGGIPPYTETQNYVKRVQSTMGSLRR